MTDHQPTSSHRDIVATDPTGAAVTYGELLARFSQQDIWAVRTLCELNGTEPPEFARLPDEVQLELPLG